MDYKLPDLIDINLVQTLLSRLNELFPFPSAITDIQGNILAANAWQDICTKFHRVNPQAEKECQLSDRYISSHLNEANPAVIYHCPHGLVDCAIPIIIEGRHLGNLFTGQIFLESPDPEHFRKQALHYGFDESSYLEAVKKVPVWTRSELDKYLGVLASMLDILVSIGAKQLRKIEHLKTIRESEKRFKVFFDGAPDAVFLADAETGIIVDANYAASKLLGRPVAEIIGMHQSQLHPAREGKEARIIFRKRAESRLGIGETPPIENVIVNSEGTEIPVEILANTMTIEGRKVIQGIFRDITKRKQIESELISSEKKYRTLAENLPDVVARFDKDLRHTYVNPVVEKITGIPVHEFLGKTNEDLMMPPENVQVWNENLKWVFENGKHHTFEFSFSKNNLVRFFSSLLVPEFDQEGNVCSVLSVARDVTGLKKSEIDLRIQHEISIMLGQASDLSFALNCLLVNVCQLEGVDCGVIFLVDQLTGSIDQATHYGLSKQFVSRSSILSFDSAGAGIVPTGKPVFISYPDILESNNLPAIQEKLHSISIIPIMHNGTAVASLALASHFCDEVPADTKMALESIASNLGGTIARLKAERMVVDNEVKYQLLFENITQGFASHEIILDETGAPVDYRFLSVNPAFERLTGQKAENVIGKRVLEILPETEKYWIELYGKVALTGKDTHFENYSRELNKYFEVWAFCQKIGEFAVTFNDITKRKRNEEMNRVMYAISAETSKSNDLEELMLMIREQLKALIDVTNFCIALYDEGTDSFSVPFYRDQMDMLSDFPAAKTLTAYVTRNRKSVLCRQSEVEEMVRAGLIESSGTMAKAWLGLPLLIKEKPIGAFILQSYDDENAFTWDDVSMLEFVSQQISSSIQQKKAEQEIKMALEKAEESNRLKTAFLANLSHELRTPMNGILGFAELLASDSLTNEERDEYLSVINYSGQSLLDVITNIMDISKIDTRQFETKIGSFSLNQLLDELLKWFGREKVIKDKAHLDVEVRKGLRDNEDIITSDPVKIRHIFNLLLNNAAKFTSKGYIHFGYSIHGKHIRFFVKDSGKGIRPDNQTLIFERFRQEDETFSRNYGGVGLGLTIAKGLVEMLEGSIWVESEPEKGSTFFFEIPLKR